MNTKNTKNPTADKRSKDKQDGVLFVLKAVASTVISAILSAIL